MRFVTLLGLLLVAAVALQDGAPTARSVVRAATAAVEGDSVARMRGRWTRAAAATPPDRVALLGLATLARLTYDYRTADSLYARLLADSLADPAAVYAALGSGLAARTRGLQRAATGWFDRAWADAERSGDRAAQAEALIMIAATRARTAGPVVAESLFRRARQLTTGDAQLEALYHCGHAELLALSFQSAEGDAQRGAELATQAGDGRLAAGCYHYVAADRGRRGGFILAREAFERAASERRRLRDRAGLATTLQWRGFMLRSIGWIDDARRDLEEAVVEARASGNTSAEAWSLINLAFIALSIGDASGGARLADSAVTLFDAQGDRYALSLVQGVRGGIAATAGDHAAAQRMYLESQKSAEAVQDGASLVVVHTYLAHLAMRRRDWAEAKRELEEARIVAAKGGMTGRLEALWYHRGTLALHSGQLREAERELTGGLVRNESRGPDAQHDWEYFYRMRLAEVAAQRGNLRRAESLAVAGTEALDSWRATLSRREMRLLAFQVAEDQSDPDLGLATIIAALARGGLLDEAFSLAERLRARELLDHLARADGLAAGDEGRDTSRGPSRLAAHATRSEVAAALPDDHTALVEFVTGRGGEPTTVFVLTRNSLQARVVAPIDTVAPLIERFVSLLASGADPRGLARDLGSLLLDPALSTLPAGISRLVVVPDGALHRLPIEALSAPDGRVLLDHYAIGLAPSATVFTRLHHNRAERTGVRVLAVGDPDLPAHTESFTRGGPDFTTLARLPASRREARLVARFAPGSTLRLGGGASEAWLKHAALTDYRVLHFATHARADESNLAGTAIALAPGDGEDGLLGAGELGRLRTDADLVVLSACESGGGMVVRGEGIVGLAMPLFEAGARAIALTRWTISDQSTVSFIERFYLGLAAGENAADALRSAKLDAIRRGASPAEWAAFTVIGDPTIRVPLRTPSGRPALWAIALGVAVLATGLGLVRRARRGVRD